MSYRRVIPRDLFNEANLLKCLGRLVLLEDTTPGLRVRHNGEAFGIHQNDYDGSIFVANVRVSIHGRDYLHYTPLNSREAFPLWLQPEDYGEDVIEALDATGGASEDLRALSIAQ